MWWRRFKARHDTFSLRSPGATASVRHDAMTRQRMACYFHELGNIIQSLNLKDHPSRIWNMDETGITMSQKRNKVLAKKGAKTVHVKVSMSRELFTVIACGNANGDYLPPHFVIPGKTKRNLESYDLEAIVEDGSSLRGSNFSVSDSGWTKR